MFPCDTGYICDRDTVEQRWAERLEAAGVDIQTGTSIGIAEFQDLSETYDYVVDATGQPSLTTKALGRTDAYTGDMIALNADVEGDFMVYRKTPRIFFEGYVGYSWSFPKSATRANVGIGWAGNDRPDNYIEALWNACERNNLPKPTRDNVHIYTIPAGPSLDPKQAYLPDENVFLVGDAAGIANRYQGEGICQAIRSSYLLADLVYQNRDAEYPEQLYELMKSEYRLAHLMKGTWVEHHNPALLASVTDCLDGLTIDEITRNPNAVMGRLARQPAIAAHLVANRGMIRRIIDAYTNSGEYSTS